MAANDSRVYLEMTRIGGSNFTSVEALARFFAALGRRTASEPVPAVVKPKASATRNDSAAAKLEEYGF